MNMRMIVMGGWIAVLTLFDTAANAQTETAEVAPAPSHFGHEHVPASTPTVTPADKPAETSTGAMGSMDMAPSPAPGEPMAGMDMGSTPASGTPMETMDMGAMQGGRAPPDARDPDAYADGYEYTGMSGMEATDRIAFGMVLADELEFLSGNEGEGYAWSLQGNYGDDRNKLWLRTQGLRLPGETDPTTSGEALWYRPSAAFWGTQLGLRQDFGAGAHTFLAFGAQGLAPYWFDIEATGYVGDDGRLSARLKAAYEMRFTNRLILVPSVEANAYSKSESERGVGAGLGNIEAGIRLRYELHRKFAPYIGYVWERSFAGTADRRRLAGDPVNERRFVAGIRMWW